jgi:hypothetical protein
VQEAAPAEETLERRFKPVRLHQWLGNPPALILAAALCCGFLSGLFAIHNSSIGWHLGSGRWMLEHRQVVRGDPFSYTATGSEWIDHEWLFQVTVAAIESLGGAPALIGTRCLLLAALAGVLLAIGLRSGLAPPVALVLAAICIYGARMRFFLRPELCTLLIVPLAVWIYLERHQHRDYWWLLRLALVVVLGINLHGAALICPVLLAVLWLAEAGKLVALGGDSRSLRTGAAAVAVALVVPLLNPWGWKLYTVPLKITHLVGLPHVPNPEWISPGPGDVPSLWLALALSLLVLLVRGRDLVRWVLFVAAAALALRYVRNVGLFFTLLPLVLAPVLAGWSVLSAGGVLGGQGRYRRLAHILAYGLVALLVLTFFVAPWHPLGISYSEQKYPIRACDFAEQQGLLDVPLYNDVIFGGYLIARFYPAHQVFIDDRNEIHEPLLKQVYEILQQSNVAGWHQLLHRYGIETALVRYHEPIRVITPDGTDHGYRGFSALWFPPSRWALVYWDDTAMLFVSRATAEPELLARYEYRVTRPDDLDFLLRRLGQGKLDRRQLASEVHRKLVEDPLSERAIILSDALLTR